MTGSKDHKDKVFNLRQDGLLCLLLLIAILVSYWQVTGYEFVNFDDDLYITKNAHVRAGLTPESIKWSLTATSFGNWHPLTWLSHVLDIQLFGMNPGRHHLISLIFHIANSLLLFLVLKRMTGAFWQSFFVAALFALHPLNVESVAWVSERKNVLSTFFWLLAMGGYTLYVERPNVIRYILVFLLLFLGLTAKAMLVTLPFVLLLLDYWPLGRLQFGKSGAVINKQQRWDLFRLVWEKIPLFVLSAISSAVTFYAEKQGGSISSLDLIPFKARVSNALVSYVNYLGKMIWPADMAALYPHPGMLPWWKIAVACLVLVSISYLAVSIIRQKPYFAVGWLWYLGTLVPVIGLVQVGRQAMADRYAYVPLIGIFIVISWAAAELVARLSHRRMWLSVSATVVLSILTAVTWKQVRYWKNSITLFEHAIEITDNNSIMHCGLGVVLKDKGRTDEAIYHYSEALRINPYSADAHYNLANALTDKGRMDEAVAHFLRALQIEPDDVEIHNNLGNALSHQGRIDEAVDHFSRALQIDPDNAKAHNNLGNTLSHQGRIDEAIDHFSKALHINPGYAEAHNNLGVTLAKAGRAAEAIDHFVKALRSNSNYTEAHMNLGVELNNQGRIDEAIDHFQKALSLKPEFPEAMYHLAKLYIIRDEHEKALSLYQKVLSFLPDNPAVYYNIACIYARQNMSEQSVLWLQKAVDKGFDDWKHIKTDSDLDNIRGSLSYKKLVKGHVR